MCSGHSCGKSVWLKHPDKPQFLLGELRVCLEGFKTPHAGECKSLPPFIVLALLVVLIPNYKHSLE